MIRNWIGNIKDKYTKLIMRFFVAILSIFLVLAVSGCTECHEAHDVNRDFIVCGGQEIGKEYDTTRSPILINGKLAYIAENDSKTLIVYDNQIISEYEHDYSSWRGLYRIESLKEINGKLAYLVEEYPYSNRYYLVYDGKDIGKEYYSIEEPIGIDGKLAYITRVNSSSSFVIFDGQEIGKEYDVIINITEINGKLTYIALQREYDAYHSRTFVIFDGQQIGNYEDIDRDSLIEVDGKPAFLAKSSSGNFIVYDGKEIGKEYRSMDTNTSDNIFYNIDKPLNVNGKLAYYVEECVSNRYTNVCHKIFYVYDGIQTKV